MSIDLSPDRSLSHQNAVIKLRWWKHMADVMPSHPDPSQVSAPLREVFHPAWRSGSGQSTPNHCMTRLSILFLTVLCALPALPAAETAVRFKKQPTGKWSAVIPADKKLSPEWERSLFERGAPRSYTGEDLMNIGMPVGGITTGGLVYLGGDGKLWNWDIFNRPLNCVKPRQIQYKNRSWHGLPQGLGAWQGGNYVEPVRDQPSPFAQGFALKLKIDGKEQFRTLDRKGWKDVVFTGAYPFGSVIYSDPDCAVKVTLDGYSPFSPLHSDDSSYPASIMSYRVENTGTKPVDVEIGGWLENPVLIDTISGFPGILRTNHVSNDKGTVMLVTRAEYPAERQSSRPVIVFEDFEKPAYDGWEVEGTAFGTGPVAKQDVPVHVGETGMNGGRAVPQAALASRQTVHCIRQHPRQRRRRLAGYPHAHHARRAVARIDPVGQQPLHRRTHSRRTNGTGDGRPQLRRRLPPAGGERPCGDGFQAVQWRVVHPDPGSGKPEKPGAYETVHIAQVMGQGWAWQVGLGRVLSEDTTRSALRSLPSRDSNAMAQNSTSASHRDSPRETSMPRSSPPRDGGLSPNALKTGQ
jgi:hypothetical protein